MDKPNNASVTTSKSVADTYLHSKSEQISELGEFTTLPPTLLDGFEQIDNAQPTDDDRARMTSFHPPTSLGFWKFRIELADGIEVFALRHAWDRCGTNRIQPDGNQLIFYSPCTTESASITWFDAR